MGRKADIPDPSPKIKIGIRYTWGGACIIHCHLVLQGATSAERWQHLADLVEFAFALKEALDRINSQSFNSFMLRIGRLLTDR